IRVEPDNDKKKAMIKQLFDRDQDLASRLWMPASNGLVVLQPHLRNVRIMALRGGGVGDYGGAGRAQHWRAKECRGPGRGVPDDAVAPACRTPRARKRGTSVQRYILRRLLFSIPVLLLTSVIVFALLHTVPGDVIVAKLADQGTVKNEDIETMRRQYGLDK